MLLSLSDASALVGDPVGKRVGSPLDTDSTWSTSAIGMELTELLTEDSFSNAKAIQHLAPSLIVS